MKLNKLRLLGFKSFVEPTDFLIEHGLTGVVGPNGCGKSNLVEALRWVMGETSHKSMRAAGMDDVIFNGTNTRPARNAAEVMLFLDNDDRSAPAQFNEHDALEDLAPHRARQGLDLSGQCPRSARARRAAAVRRRLDRRAFARARASGPHRRDHPGQARAAPPRAGRSRRRRRPACAPPRGRAAAEGSRDEPRAARGRDRPAGAADGRAQAPGAPGGEVSPGLGRRAQGRGDTVPPALGRGQRRGRRQPRRPRTSRMRVVAEATGAQAQAATNQANAAAALPPLREDEASAAAGLARLNNARETLDREESRANESASPSSTAVLSSLLRISSASSASPPMRRPRSNGSRPKRRGSTQDTESVAAREQSVAARVAEAEGRARRGREDVLRTDLRARRPRGAAQSARARGRRAYGAPDAARRSGRRGRDRARRASTSRKTARLILRSSRTQSARRNRRSPTPRPRRLRAEAAYSSARQGLDVARGPLAEAERRVGRLEAEAKALAKMIDVEAKKLWPPAIDLLTVEKGYEGALGAALGDDLEAPVDPASPIRWAGAAVDGADPALPEGAEPLARHVTAPAELARRLAQIGVVDRALGATLVAQLKPGPAARLARGRPVALGRLRGRLECADRGRAPAGGEEPPRGPRIRAHDRAHRRGRQAPPRRGGRSRDDRRRRRRNRDAQRPPRGARRARTRRATRMRPPSARPTV